MKNTSKFRSAAVVCYIAAVLLFLAFFIYMGSCENVSVYSSRSSHHYTTVTDYDKQTLTDTAAPIGVRTEYRWVLEDLDSGESCLCFYIVHHYAEVSIDGELIYSLTASETNRIGGSISSNWVTVPLHQEDAGKEITIILTPLFQSVADSGVTFLLGSHYSIFLDLMKQDIPHLFLALLCILLGFFIMIVQVYFSLHTRSPNWNIFFLGNFSVLLGITRITDAMSSPALFSGNPMLLGYISIGTLFLTCIPLLLFMSTLFPNRAAMPLLILSLISSGVSILALILQVFGIADFKEVLSLSHILLIVTIVGIPLNIVLHNRKQQYPAIGSSWRIFLLLGCGILLDVTFFYVTGSSSDIIFTILGFVIYVIIVFVSNILDTTRKAYTDPRTGLANKSRWNELMNVNTPITEPTAILMMDLNGLKQVNDTLGHEEGDKLIFNFSNILRNTLPSSSVICRWGGDEFTVLLTGMTPETVEHHIHALEKAVDEYNTLCEPPIHYALGWAFSEEHPGLTRKELLLVADDRMYRNKEQWYQARYVHTDPQG